MCKKVTSNEKLDSIDDTLTAILFHIKKLISEGKSKQIKKNKKEGE